MSESDLQMTPMINETVVNDRIQAARRRAEERRMARVARTGALRRAGAVSMRTAVGHRLIAIGERMVDRPMPDPASLDRAA